MQNHWVLVDLWWLIYNLCIFFLNRTLPFMYLHDQIWGTLWYANQYDHWATANLSDRNTTSPEGRLFNLFNRKAGLCKPVQTPPRKTSVWIPETLYSPTSIRSIWMSLFCMDYKSAIVLNFIYLNGLCSVFKQLWTLDLVRWVWIF